MYCIHCGKPMPDDAEFCPSCGKAQSPAAAAATEQPRVVVKPGLSKGALIAIIAAVLFFPMIAIVGILAAIAIPAYQDYTVRAHIAGGLSEASPLKRAYADLLTASGERPTDIGDLGYVPQIKPPLQHIALIDGLLVLQFDASLDNDTLALEPWLDERGEVSWVCGFAGLPDRDDVSTMRSLADAGAAEMTSIDQRHLPGSCR